jgi:hypothetical protein
MKSLFHFLLAAAWGVNLLGCLALPLSAEPSPAIRAARFNSNKLAEGIQVQAAKLLAAGKLISLRQLGQTTLHPQHLALAPLFTTKLSSADLHDKLLPSTLVVSLYFRGIDGTMNFFVGAGFALAPGGILSTCAHMMQYNPTTMTDAYPIAVDATGRVYPIVELLAFDPAADTCIVRAQGADFPPLPLRTGARAGEDVYCLAHPDENYFVFTSGIVNRVDSKTVEGRTIHLLDVSCDYSPGSSGAPITDNAGNVVAQVDKIYPNFMWMGDNHAASLAATVFNLHVATAADEIILLAHGS